MHDTRSTKHNFNYTRVAEFRRVRVKTLLVRIGINKCYVALTRMQLKQSSFYSSFGQQEPTDPRTGANLFDDRMRKKRTVELAVFEIDAAKLIDLV